MSEVHQITLEGCDTARMGDLSYTSSKGGVIGPLVRKAVREGVLTEDCMVAVYRNGNTAFLPCKASVFSTKSLKEDDLGLRHIKYKPYEGPKST